MIKTLKKQFKFTLSTHKVDKFYVYQLESPAGTFEGIATEEIIAQIEKCPILFLNNRSALNNENYPMGDEHKNIYLVNSKELISLKQEGFGSTNLLNLLSDTPYSDYIREPNNFELLILKYYNHTIYDLNNQIIPISIHMEYIGRPIVTDRFLKVQEAFDFLSQSSNISQLSIERVPYYNCSAGYKYLDFKWLPEQNVYEQLKSVDSFHQNDIIIQQDWLGLVAAGVTHYSSMEEFYNAERSTNEEDDES